MKQKVITKKEAISFIKNGNQLMVGGFGLVGSPLALVEELAQSSIKELTIISNNLGEPGEGLGKLVRNGQVKKAIGSYFTSNPDVVHANLSGKLDIELIPQGTMAEAIRAGGAGIGGFYTPSGVGTDIAIGKEQKVIKGRSYLFQESLHADVALIKAYKADTLGNLVYRKSARNFNVPMATAAKVVIVEVEEMVETGSLSAEEIVTPHLYVDYIVHIGKEKE